MVLRGIIHQKPRSKRIESRAAEPPCLLFVSYPPTDQHPLFFRLFLGNIPRSSFLEGRQPSAKLGISAAKLVLFNRRGTQRYLSLRLPPGAPSYQGRALSRHTLSRYSPYPLLRYLLPSFSSCSSLIKPISQAISSIHPILRPWRLSMA